MSQSYLTQSKYRQINKRDDHCNKSDYILINLIKYLKIFNILALCQQLQLQCKHSRLTVSEIYQNYTTYQALQLFCPVKKRWPLTRTNIYHMRIKSHEGNNLKQVQDNKCAIQIPNVCLTCHQLCLICCSDLY